MLRGPITALQEFDALLPRIASYHTPLLPPLLDQAPAVLADRLAQRFAQLFQAQFVVSRCAPARPDGTRVRLGGLSVDLATGKLQISAGLATRLMFDFILRWGFSLVALTFAAWPRSGRRSATLVYGVGADDIFRGGSDAEFAAFCERGPILPLQDAKSLIVQTGQPRKSCITRITYAKSPLHALCRSAGFGPLEALRCAWRHGAALLGLLRLAMALPASVLLARDFADAAPAAMLNDAGLLDAVVLTNSNYVSQPLWIRDRPGRGFQTHMIWYSQNVRPLLRRSDPLLRANPPNRMIRVDAMWVWTRAFADYLAEIGITAQMHAVGPILWRPPGKQGMPSGAPVISVFDVSPVTAPVALELGLMDNYYSLETAKKFLQDIVDAVERAPGGRRARIALKHKREQGGNRDHGYFVFVERLVSKHPNLSVLPTQTSLYELIADSTLTISIPFSSPVYVASHLRRASLFYDPTGELQPTFDAAPGLQFAATPDALQEAINHALREAHG